MASAELDTTAIANEGAHAWGLAIGDDGAIALCGTLDAETPHWVAHGLQAIDGTAVWSADGPGACNEARIDGDRQVWLLGEDDDGDAQILVLDHGLQVGAFDASWFPATARPRVWAGRRSAAAPRSTRRAWPPDYSGRRSACPNARDRRGPC